MDSKGQITKDLIIHKATELFYQKGYDKTTNREIASACAIALGNFNYYYSKKEDVLNDIISKGISSFQEYIEFDDNPILAFLAFHYALTQYIAQKNNLLNLYLKCFYIPSVKESFIQQVITLIKPYCKQENLNIILSNFCHLEFNMMEHYSHGHCNILDIYSVPAKAFLFFMDLPTDFLSDSINYGKTILEKRLADSSLYF